MPWFVPSLAGDERSDRHGLSRRLDDSLRGIAFCAASRLAASRSGGGEYCPVPSPGLLVPRVDFPCPARGVARGDGFPVEPRRGPGIGQDGEGPSGPVGGRTTATTSRARSIVKSVDSGRPESRVAGRHGPDRSVGGATRAQAERLGPERCSRRRGDVPMTTVTRVPWPSRERLAKRRRSCAGGRRATVAPSGPCAIIRPRWR